MQHKSKTTLRNYGKKKLTCRPGNFTLAIHCEQIRRTGDDRIAVCSRSGFVKVETGGEAPSGGVLEKSSLKLKGPLGSQSRRKKYATPQPKKLLRSIQQS